MSKGGGTAQKCGGEWGGVGRGGLELDTDQERGDMLEGEVQRSRHFAVLVCTPLLCPTV